MTAQKAVRSALDNRTIIPAFNIPFLPMVKPVCEAIRDENSIGMIQVARLEWEKFESRSPEAVAEEYFRWAVEGHTLLHLDHVPAVDEDLRQVDFAPILERAAKAGYQSMMVDGSRLSLAGNIEVTKIAAEIAHGAGAALEAELGAVMGHEGAGVSAGDTYEEIFRSKKGFTNVDEAREFVKATGCDWLSVAAGSIHGAIADATRRQKKPEARLDIAHIAALREATDTPLVLHGGSGIRVDCIRDAVKEGIAKINVATDIRQAWENALDERNDIEYAREAVYHKTRWVLNDFLQTRDNASRLDV